MFSHTYRKCKIHHVLAFIDIMEMSAVKLTHMLFATYNDFFIANKCYYDFI